MIEPPCWMNLEEVRPPLFQYVFVRLGKWFRWRCGICFVRNRWELFPKRGDVKAPATPTAGD